MNETDTMLPAAKLTPAEIIASPDNLVAAINAIKADVSKHELSVETADGRAQIKSLAYKVVRSKSVITAASSSAQKSHKEALAKIKASEKTFIESMDELAATVRKPLTEYEARERERKAALQKKVDRFDNLMPRPTLEEVERQIEELLAIKVEQSEYEDFTDKANVAVGNAHRRLTVARDSLIQAKKEQEEREAVMADERAKRQEEKAAREAAERQLAEHQAEIEALKAQLAAQQPEPEEKAEPETAPEPEQSNTATVLAEADSGPEPRQPDERVPEVIDWLREQKANQKSLLDIAQALLADECPHMVAG